MTAYRTIFRDNRCACRIGSLVGVLLSVIAGSSPAQLTPQTSIERSPPQPVAQSAYRLGPGDVISVRALDAEEISGQPIRIGASGNIALPLVGRIHAAGLTTEQLERELVEKLKPLIRRPEVSINVVELHSQPVSILGAVTTPGVHQLQGSKTLVEMLALAGGVRQDAGHGIKITRRMEYGAIPLHGSAVDVSGRFSVTEVNLKELVEGRAPESNIQIMPEDVISVPRAEMIYVIGEVRKSGGFTLGEQENISALKALSLAEGLSNAAAPQSARILRLRAGASKRTDVPVDLRKILEGKHDDVQLEPEDILFIPGSKTKNVALRSLEAVVQIGTGVAIYRR
jgi:polysaccharide export outer membrane protein